MLTMLCDFVIFIGGNYGKQKDQWNEILTSFPKNHNAVYKLGKVLPPL